MKNLHQKITLKGITSNTTELIKSDYNTIIVNKTSIKSLIKIGFGNAKYLNGNGLQMPNEFDLVTLTEGLFIHKHTIGDFFTYRISDDPKNQFSVKKFSNYQIRVGSFNCFFTIKNIFNNNI